MIDVEGDFIAEHAIWMLMVGMQHPKNLNFSLIRKCSSYSSWLVV
jgi:hypothetical protein